MNCKLCGKPVVLVPSAQERANKYGQTAEYYTKLFDIHAECQLEKRKRDTAALMARRRADTTK